MFFKAFLLCLVNFTSSDVDTFMYADNIMIQEEQLARRIINRDFVYISELFKFVSTNKDIFSVSVTYGNLQGVYLQKTSIKSKFFEFIFLTDVNGKVYMCFIAKLGDINQAFMSGDPDATVAFFKSGEFNEEEKDLIVLENQSIETLKGFEENK
jgi:hypothetical protein